MEELNKMKKKINKNKGMLFWVTGLSGSGKTVIAEKIKSDIAKYYGPTLLVSGDDLRKIFKFNKYTAKERKVLGKLNVDLFTLVCNNKEADDIFRSFFMAGVPELDASTDLALAETMYRAAAKFKVKYVLEGHSYIAEGITPLGKNYFDGRYIKSIHKKFGKLKMKTYPLMTFNKFIKWTVFYRIKKIRPLWYIDYSKEAAKDFLKNEYGSTKLPCPSQSATQHS